MLTTAMVSRLESVIARSRQGLGMMDAYIEHCIRELQVGYQQLWGTQATANLTLLAEVAAQVFTALRHTDAAYHNVEHTVLVTLTGQEILRGKWEQDRDLTPHDWLHCILALLCHDVGYVKGFCRRDRAAVHQYATGIDADHIELAPTATDASLALYHIDRGKQIVLDWFAAHPVIDATLLAQHIEMTRFPVPADAAHQATKTLSGLMRAADLLGQLADPRYLEKLPDLYQEFAENGTNQSLGYTEPQDLRHAFPSFFWQIVYPYVQDALQYLEITPTGKQIMVNLYANVFIVEYETVLSQQVPMPSRQALTL